MRAAYEAFRSGSGPATILAAAGGDAQGSAAFYANLYVGLYHEAEGETEAAKEAIVQVCSFRVLWWPAADAWLGLGAPPDRRPLP